MDIRNWYDVAEERGLDTTADGNILYIEDFYMPQLDRYRDIWIYLPKSYDRTRRRRFPVLYMHDGQNVFDDATSYSGKWGVGDTLEQKRRYTETIVVAVANGAEHRMSEYAPDKEGPAYADFLALTLKPFIDSTFRTRWERECTGTAGSSMGGLISLYIGCQYEELFSRIGAFSPSLIYNPDLYKGWEPSYPMRIYLDVGFKEGLPYMSDYKYATEVWKLYFRMTRSGFPMENLWFNLDPHAPHSEWAWRDRFGPAFSWLYKKGTF